MVDLNSLYHHLNENIYIYSAIALIGLNSLITGGLLIKYNMPKMIKEIEDMEELDNLENKINDN